MGFLSHINRMLIEIKNNSTAELKSANKSLVFECIERNFHVGENNPNERILSFGINLSLIQEENNRLKVTSEGKQIIDFMPIENEKPNITPNDRQKQFIISLFSQTKFKDRCKLVFSAAKKDYSVKPSKIYFIKQLFEKFEHELTFFSDIGFIFKNGVRYEINSKFITEYYACLSPKFSKDWLKRKQKAQDKIGKKGEELSFQWEKNRLTKAERWDLARLVHDVSDDFALGYDIDSFNGDNENYEHDMRIESKATSSNEKKFYWSEEESKVAEDEGENYWIYLWTNIWSEKPELTRIQNPIKKIRKEHEYDEKPTEWIVSSNDK